MTAVPTPLEAAALDALRQFPDPLTGQDWASARRVRQLKVVAGGAEVDIVLGYPARSQWPAYPQLVEAALLRVDGVREGAVNWSTDVVAHQATRGQALLPGVKNLVAVAS